MSKRTKILIVLAMTVILVSGCSEPNGQPPSFSNPDSSQPEEEKEPIVGGDRDEHGCIGSAGYSWCEPKGKCLRIWEEACEDNAKE